MAVNFEYLRNWGGIYNLVIEAQGRMANGDNVVALERLSKAFEAMVSTLTKQAGITDRMVSDIMVSKGRSDAKANLYSRIEALEYYNIISDASKNNYHEMRKIRNDVMHVQDGGVIKSPRQMATDLNTMFNLFCHESRLFAENRMTVNKGSKGSKVAGGTSTYVGDIIKCDKDIKSYLTLISALAAIFSAAVLMLPLIVKEGSALNSILISAGIGIIAILIGWLVKNRRIRTIAKRHGVEINKVEADYDLFSSMVKFGNYKAAIEKYFNYQMEQMNQDMMQQQMLMQQQMEQVNRDMMQQQMGQMNQDMMQQQMLMQKQMQQQMIMEQQMQQQMQQQMEQQMQEMQKLNMQTMNDALNAANLAQDINMPFNNFFM